MTTSLWALAYLLLVAFALYCAWRAIQGARTPQGAVGWAVFLVSLPILAVPAYLILGHHRLRGVEVARRDSAQVVDAVRDYSADRRPDAISQEIFGPFEAAAQLPVLRGNAADLLIDGRAAFDEMFAAIDAAERYILVQFYIVRSDDLGTELQDRLIAARARGVAVYVSYDRIGSHALKDDFRAALIKAGAQVIDPRLADGKTPRLRINFRNHRKTVIVDGMRGFTGGLNVGDEYLGLDPAFGAWRDTHVALRGPMVAQLQLIFVEDWHVATQQLIADDLHWRPGLQPDDMAGLIVATGPADEFDTGSMLFFAAITAARQRVWIASPYFVPDIDTLTALKHAALRGVEVREAGVEVWRYTEGFMHQKVILVDEAFAGVGTTNMDNRSFRLNFEAMAMLFDPVFAARVATMLDADFARAFRMTRMLAEQPRRVRVGARVARLFAPIL